MKSQPTRNSWSKQSGFSLVELMVVVAIIGVLASLAVPRFKTFQAKARQAEAKTNLAHLYTLQQSFHADYDTYAGSSRQRNQIVLAQGWWMSKQKGLSVAPTVSGSL